MKVALVVERMDTARGGRETSVAQTALALRRRGHQVTILCGQGSWSAEGVEVVELGRRGPLRVQRLRNFVDDVRRAAGARELDIIHATLPVPGANVYQPRGGTVPGQRAGSRRRRSGPARLVSDITSGLNFRRNRMGELEYETAVKTDALCLGVSEMVADEFREFYRCSERVRVVYNGVDVPDPRGERRADDRQRMRYKLGVSPEGPVFLCAAKNFPLKGVLELIVAFARWYHRDRQRPDARLVIVGRDTPEGYQRIAALRDVGNRVVFVGWTPEIFDWYAAADAVVLLSWYDPCSRVVLEAARWGIPSMTTRFNGAAEAFGDAGCIVVDSPKDVRAVVDGLDELADPDRRERHAEACREIADQLSTERHVDRLVEVYAEAPRLK